MPAPEIAVAYVSVVPSLQGFAGDLRRQITPAANAAGDSAGEGFSSGFKAKALAGGAVIAAGFAKLMGDAFEQANVTSKLGASLGASSKDAAKYGKISGQLLAKGVVDNFEEGADTIRAVVNGGLVPPGATNKQLQSIATKMADVSKVFGTDMGTQTQAVSALMKNGLAPSADAALDVITTGMQKLGPNADDLLDSFASWGLTARPRSGCSARGSRRARATRTSSPTRSRNSRFGRLTAARAPRRDSRRLAWTPTRCQRRSPRAVSPPARGLTSRWTSFEA
jgi:hypothetical protein